jgi:hypothetical protein
MLTRRTFLRWTAGALAGAGAQGSSRVARAREHVPLAVVVAKNGPIEGLSRFELKKLYLGSNLQAPGGERILAFHQMSDAPDRIAFEQHVTGMQPEQLARYWIDRKIRGEGGVPRAVGSVELLQRVVSRLTHSVGYVRSDQIGPELRAIPIDGALPGEPGYPIAGDPERTAGGGALLDVEIGSALFPAVEELFL